MKKIFFIVSLFLMTAAFGTAAYAMEGLNVSMSAPAAAKPGEEISVTITVEVPGGQDIQGIQIDFSYSTDFPSIDNDKCAITKNTSGWALVGITKANILTVGERLENNAVVEGNLVFSIPENNALAQYTVYIENAVAAANGEEINFNIENNSVTINVEGGSSSSVTEETKETTTAGTSESGNSSSSSNSSGASSSSGKSSGSSSSSSSRKSTDENSETTSAAEETQDLSSAIIMKIDSTTMTVFGEKMTNDVPPIISNSRTMLPIRFISECMGAQVDWNSASKEITITYGKTTIKLAIGSSEIDINGKKSEIDTVPFIQNSRTYVPIRFISEAMGLDVFWNETDKIVTIAKND